MLEVKVEHRSLWPLTKLPYFKSSPITIQTVVLFKHFTTFFLLLPSQLV